MDEELDIELEEDEPLEKAFPKKPAPAKARESKPVSPLPASNDSKFWGEDAEVVMVETPKPLPPTGCHYVWHGPWEVCISCANQHTRTPQAAAN